MWWVKESTDHDRNGFQDRDVGKTNFNDDYGPDFGVDFARFTDPPDVVKDGILEEKILRLLSSMPEFSHVDLTVRNGFVFLKGYTREEGVKSKIERLVSRHEGVRHVVIQLS